MPTMGTVAAQREAGLLPTGGEAVAGNRGFQKTPVPTLRDMGIIKTTSRASGGGICGGARCVSVPRRLLAFLSLAGASSGMRAS